MSLQVFKKAVKAPEEKSGIFEVLSSDVYQCTLCEELEACECIKLSIRALAALCCVPSQS